MNVKITSVHKDVKRQRISVVPHTQGALMSKEILNLESSESLIKAMNEMDNKKKYR